jgi:hypothetical protein
MSREAARLIVARNLRAVDGGYAWRSDPRLTLPSHLRVAEDFIRAWLRALDVPTWVLCADPAPPYFRPELRDARVEQVRDVRCATFTKARPAPISVRGCRATCRRCPSRRGVSRSR